MFILVSNGRGSLNVTMGVAGSSPVHSAILRAVEMVRFKRYSPKTSVTQGVAGSSPVHSAIIREHDICRIDQRWY